MKRCRICAGESFAPVYDLGNMPIAHRILESKEALESTYPFALHVCERCGLVQILDPIDPEILYGQYNYNFSSWKPEPHLTDEVDRVMSTAAPDSVVEIGCNDGLFLSHLRDRGVGKIVGIEPNPVSGKLARERGFDVRSSMVNEELCRAIVAETGQFDLVVSRQVIEHIGDLAKFFACVDILLKPSGHVFFDIPDFAPARAMGDLSVLWEEHVNYFSPALFDMLLARHGLLVKERAHYNFSGGTYAVIAGRGDGGRDADAKTEIEAALTFGEKVGRYARQLTSMLQSHKDAGRRVAIYGAGVRACTATNGLRLEPYLDVAIDDQKERQGKYLPGARTPIVGSDELKSREIALCLLAVNAENEERVKARASAIHPTLKFASLCVPTDIWADLESVS